MAGGNDAGEKTEKPTAKKLQDAAKKGDILQSRELGTALVVMAGIGCLAITGPSLVEALRKMLVEALRFRREDIVDFSPAERGMALLTGIALPVAGVMLATFIAAIAAPALLGSLGFRPGAFAPKPEKLNPLSGIKRIFGMQGLIELVKSIAKVGLLGSIGVWLIWDRLAEIAGLGKTGIAPAIADVGNIFIFTCLVMAGGLFLIAGIDVPAQMMQRAKRLGMSKQEVKDEHKESEGSPELKGHIRRRQFEVLSGSAGCPARGRGSTGATRSPRPFANWPTPMASPCCNIPTWRAPSISRRGPGRSSTKGCIWRWRPSSLSSSALKTGWRARWIAPSSPFPKNCASTPTGRSSRLGSPGGRQAAPT